MENIAFIELTERKLELKIVQSRQGRYRVLEDVINQYDLTNDITKDCLFSPKSRTDILKILNIYRYTIETYNVSKMIAFASNIIVKARNYRGLLDEIYTHTGMNFTLTNNDEVIRDIYQAINSKIDLSKISLFEFIDLTISLVRDIMVIIAGKNELVTNKLIIVDLIKFSNQYNLISVEKILKMLNNARKNLFFNSNAQMVLDELLLDFVEVKVRCKKLLA